MGRTPSPSTARRRRGERKRRGEDIRERVEHSTRSRRGGVDEDDSERETRSSRRHRSQDRERRRITSRSRSRERDRRRSRSRSRDRDRDRSRGRPSSSRAGGSGTKISRPEISEADLEGKTPEEIEMMKTMGFCNFDTTKGKKVEGNDVGEVHVILKRKYRQYMNRKGGFNRPLDFVA